MLPRRLQGYGMPQPDHTVPKSIRGLQFGPRRMNTMSGDPAMVHFQTNMSGQSRGGLVVERYL
jgi:hypothetical protein